MVLRFQDFVNESVYNTGVPVYRENNLNPEQTIKRNRVISEIENYLSEVASGTLSEVTVVADIPLQGKNMPEYLKDVYSEVGYDPSKDRDSEGASRNVFVDSEFLVKDVDESRGVIIASPYSMRRKGILIEINVESIEEIFIK